MPTPHTEDDMRFSDARLAELERKLYEHDALEVKWRAEDSAKQADIDKRLDKLFEAQKQNTQDISMLIKETAFVIQLSKDIHGSARIGAGVQRFFFWIIKWGAVGAFLGTMLKWFTENVLGKSWP